MTKQVSLQWRILNYSTIIDLDHRNKDNAPHVHSYPTETHRFKDYHAIKHTVSIIENGTERVVSIWYAAPSIIGKENIPLEPYESSLVNSSSNVLISKGVPPLDWHNLVMVTLDMEDKERGKQK